MKPTLEVLGYPNGQVRPLENQTVMVRLFEAMQEAGFTVTGSTDWFEAKDDRTTFVFQVGA